MADTYNDYVGQLNSQTLTPIVRKALNNTVIEVTQWKWTDVSGSGGGYGNSAVYRIAGQCTDGQETLDWSLILKIMREQPHENPASSHYWKREFEAYQSDWLNNLPSSSLAAPRCYHTEWSRGESARIWLEDLGDAEACRSQELLARSAYHMGQFNGLYMVDKPLPKYPWLSTDWIRQDFLLGVRNIAELEGVDSNRHVHRLWHPKRRANVQRLYTERETILTALDKLPKTVLHLDAFGRNLFMRYVDGQEQTVAVDWAFTGIQAVGAELVSLVFVSLLLGDVPVARAVEFEKQVFAAYIAGLHDVGWKGDVTQVRLGFTAAIGLRHVGALMGMRQVLVDEGYIKRAEEIVGLPIDAILDHINEIGEFIDDLTHEAWDLINAQ